VGGIDHLLVRGVLEIQQLGLGVVSVLTAKPMKKI
jgi:hypothetical protein